MKDWTERAAEAARSILADFGFIGIESAPGDPRSLGHLRYMAEELLKADMTPTKACRWLGYLQAGLIFHGWSDLDREKARNQRTGDRPYQPRGFYKVAEAKERSYGRAVYQILSNGGIVEATVYGSSAKAKALGALYNNEATLTTEEPDFYAVQFDEGWETRPKGTWNARPCWAGIAK